jgi:AMP nucleosidase
MQNTLEKAAEVITSPVGNDLKEVMRTGTVASVDNRNWGLGEQTGIIHRLPQSRAIAPDLQSAPTAANGCRCRAPCETLLCVTDKPLHGEIKLAGMTDSVYRQQVGQHLESGLRTLEILESQERERLHSQKLRNFTEVAF